MIVEITGEVRSRAYGHRTVKHYHVLQSSGVAEGEILEGVEERLSSLLFGLPLIGGLDFLDMLLEFLCAHVAMSVLEPTVDKADLRGNRSSSPTNDHYRAQRSRLRPSNSATAKTK